MWWLLQKRNIRIFDTVVLEKLPLFTSKISHFCFSCILKSNTILSLYIFWKSTLGKDRQVDREQNLHKKLCRIYCVKKMRFLTRTKKRCLFLHYNIFEKNNSQYFLIYITFYTSNKIIIILCKKILSKNFAKFMSLNTYRIELLFYFFSQ